MRLENCSGLKLLDVKRVCFVIGVVIMVIAMLMVVMMIMPLR